MVIEIQDYIRIISFFVALICFFTAMYHFGNMIAGIKSNKKVSANFIAPLLPFLSSYFDKEGNYHRIWFIITLLLCGLTILPFIFVESSEAFLLEKHNGN